ncbi:pentatricopeptide repeat-containing protein [Pyrus ussuriensis x Pyrus communis]|uniref:Pentatricopeptide repeat-containing protein n=1 Tax=Pyrus ussuriensis x Pyrus communis TaxID=2448454 RepID=A0A5N5HDK6_9ROSA|nr:pentatricopeptide repeat-containing protein [Pyrus ussuriensis x Pyrus communis]
MGPSPTQPIFVYNNILSQYFSLGELSVARQWFDKMPDRNAVSYNIIISAYSRCGCVREAWRMFSEMRCYGFELTQYVFGGLLTCGSLDVYHGVQLHSLVMKNGLFDVDAFAGTSLLSFYGRHGLLKEAVWAFEDMPCKSLVTWNSMISILGNHGFADYCVVLFRELLRKSYTLSEGSFVGILSSFSCQQDLGFGEQLHSLAIKNGFKCEVLVVNSIMSMYVKCTDICSAEKVLDEVTVQDVVSWNTIIGAVAKTERSWKALELFSKMSMDGVLPSEIIFVSLIYCCNHLEMPCYGESFHAKTIQNAFESNVFVGSALIDFYTKCDNLENAHRCFNEIYAKNVVSWNALIWGYSNIYSPASIFLMQEMLHLGYRPTEFTFSAVLKSSLALEAQQLHCLIIRMGFQEKKYVLDSLITSYAKNGLISHLLVFLTTSADGLLAAVPCYVIAGICNGTKQYDDTPKLPTVLEKLDLVSWNCVIGAFARSDYYKGAFELYKWMQWYQVLPDNYTFVSLLSVCAKLCNFSLGSSLHCYIVKTNFNCCDTFVCNMLIDMYGKCGSIGSSVKIFEEMEDKNLFTWTALISALGFNGHALEAIKRFREMILFGLKPDVVTFGAMLTACRHGGLVTDGIKLLGQMKKDYGVEPEMDHYHCVVDLLAKSGHVREAEKVWWRRAKSIDFNGNNFDFWQIKMKIIFHPTWNLVEKGFNTLVKKEKELSAMESKLLQENLVKDARALGIIQGAVSDQIFPQIAAQETAKAAWDILKQEFVRDKQVRDLETIDVQDVVAIPKGYEQRLNRHGESSTERTFASLNISSKNNSFSGQSNIANNAKYQRISKPKGSGEYVFPLVFKTGHQLPLRTNVHQSATIWHRRFRNIKDSFLKESSWRAKEPLELVHSDVCDLMQVPTMSGNSLCIVEHENFEDVGQYDSLRKAMEEEMDMIEKNNTWEWCKRTRQGWWQRDMHKSQELTYETFAPVARLDTIRTLVALAAQKNWKLF